MERVAVLARHVAPAGGAAPAAAAAADDVVSSENGCVRVVALNRPAKLNALSLSMIRGLRAVYDDVARSSTVRCLILKGTGRAFCAGGDVAAVRASALSGGTLAQDFFFEEYALIHVIAEMEKRGVSQITLWDGISMGGGVGLGIHAPFRVVTERTVFAKPETRIGLFPDVGSTHALPRLRCGRAVGLYIALTGARLHAADLMWSGLATHYVPSSRLDSAALAAGIAAAGGAEADRLLREQGGGAVPDQSKATLEPHAAAINRCFGKDTMEGVFAALEAETADREWAQATLKTLRDMSPTALKVTLEACRRHGAASCSLADALTVEYRIAQRCALRPQPLSDFHEGVRAVLVDKNKPSYSPSSIEGVSRENVDSFFVPLEPGHHRGDLRLPWP